MAMISCPNCGEQISDKAKKCVHCGHILVEEPKRICSECGAELEEGELICPKCGCPVEEQSSSTEEEEPQKVEVTKVNIKPAINKKAITIVVAVIAVIICAVFGIRAIQQQNAIKEAEKLSADYSANLQTVSISMLAGASAAEDCGNLIKKVWYNSIYEESDPETDKYTKIGTWTFVDSFNDALGNLFSDSSFSDRISAIEENQQSVANLMKDMKNPPDDWRDAYEDLQTLYDSYVELTNLVTSPSGSLQTYSSNFNDADSAFANAYGKMKLYFD